MAENKSFRKVSKFPISAFFFLLIKIMKMHRSFQFILLIDLTVSGTGRIQFFGSNMFPVPIQPSPYKE